MNSRKIGFQLISSEYGIRTPLMVCTMDECLSHLDRPEIAATDAYVLVLIEFDEAGELEFSKCPLMRISSFLQVFNHVVTDEVTV